MNCEPKRLYKRFSSSRNGLYRRTQSFAATSLPRKYVCASARKWRQGGIAKSRENMRFVAVASLLLLGDCLDAIDLVEERLVSPPYCETANGIALCEPKTQERGPGMS